MTPYRLVLGLILLCTGVEAALWGADLGLWGPTRLRQTAYEYGGFWPGLLSGWHPNFPGQPLAMFFSYAFLHGGPGHLAVNMITLWALAGTVFAHVGARGFAVIYVGAILGGAGLYALLAPGPQPMVGASGALFGLAGAILAWDYADRHQSETGPSGVLRLAAFLIAINLVMYWALDGHLAWQTHLGGALFGLVLAWLLRPGARARPPR